ncbi:MAG TPA: hypothetical protein VKU40_16015, partial [Thermoanaerobaculia bacterium]|nr:hypothetical protein [Thermoanaerobaculia bacterium]
MRRRFTTWLGALSLSVLSWATVALAAEAPAQHEITRTISRVATWPAAEEGGDEPRAVYLAHFAEVFDDISLVNRLFLLPGDGTRVVLEARMDLAAQRLDWTVVDDGGEWWARLSVWPRVGESTPREFVERVYRMREHGFSLRFETSSGLLLQVEEQHDIYDVRAELKERGLSAEVVESVPPGVREALLFLETSLVAFDVWRPGSEPHESEDPVVGIVAHVLSRHTGDELPPRRVPRLDHFDEGAIG